MNARHVAQGTCAQHLAASAACCRRRRLPPCAPRSTSAPGTALAGRIAARIFFEGQELEIVHINEPSPIESSAYLWKWDSVHSARGEERWVGGVALCAVCCASLYLVCPLAEACVDPTGELAAVGKQTTGRSKIASTPPHALPPYPPVCPVPSLPSPCSFVASARCRPLDHPYIVQTTPPTQTDAGTWDHEAEPVDGRIVVTRPDGTQHSITYSEEKDPSKVASHCIVLYCAVLLLRQLCCATRQQRGGGDRLTAAPCCT